MLDTAVPRSWFPLNAALGGSWEQGFVQACLTKSGDEDLAESD